jgi:hypothetical protein
MERVLLLLPPDGKYLKKKIVIIVDNDANAIAFFLQDAYSAGINNEDILISIAYILRGVCMSTESDYQCDGKYDDSVFNVSSFQANPDETEHRKLACLKALLAPNPTAKVNGKHENLSQVLQDALAFCTDTDTRHRRNWDEYLKQQEGVLLLLWEIRAICLNLKILRQRKLRHQRFMIPATACSKAADSITTGAITF